MPITSYSNFMNMTTAKKLIQATNNFYAMEATSFSRTRERPWDGWQKIPSIIAPTVEQRHRAGHPYSVLDIGCGNLRFECFLKDAFPNQVFALFGVDNCTALLHSNSLSEHVSAQELDVMASLEDGTLHDALKAPPSDLTIAFGFMHHIPVPAWRKTLLAELIERTTSGGIVALTFWRFAEDADARHKAEQITEEGCYKLNIALNTNAGDYLLGWQKHEDVFRYCHSFSDEEIDTLAACANDLGAKTFTTFDADGPHDNSNRYLILQAS